MRFSNIAVHFVSSSEPHTSFSCLKDCNTLMRMKKEPQVGDVVKYSHPADGEAGFRGEIVDNYGFIGRPDDGGPFDPEDWPESSLSESSLQEGDGLAPAS